MFGRKKSKFDFPTWASEYIKNINAGPGSVIKYVPTAYQQNFMMTTTTNSSASYHMNQMRYEQQQYNDAIQHQMIQKRYIQEMKMRELGLSNSGKTKKLTELDWLNDRIEKVCSQGRL